MQPSTRVAMLGQPGASQMYSTNSSSWPSESGRPLLMVILGTVASKCSWKGLRQTTGTAAAAPPLRERKIGVDFPASSMCKFWFRA